MREELSCEDIQPMISAFYDKELSAEDMLSVEKHIGACTGCKSELDSLNKLSSLIRRSLKDSEYSNLTRELILKNKEQNIDCNKVLDDLSAYYDGEVNLKLYYLIEDHLIDCESCRKAYADLTNSSDSIKNYFKTAKESQDNEEDFVVNSVMSKIDSRQKLTRITSSLAAGIFITAVGWFVISTATTDILKDANNFNKNFKNPDDPIYVSVQDFLINLKRQLVH